MVNAPWNLWWSLLVLDCVYHFSPKLSPEGHVDTKTAFWNAMCNCTWMNCQGFPFIRVVSPSIPKLHNNLSILLTIQMDTFFLVWFVRPLNQKFIAFLLKLIIFLFWCYSFVFSLIILVNWIHERHASEYKKCKKIDLAVKRMQRNGRGKWNWVGLYLVK